MTVIAARLADIDRRIDDDAIFHITLCYEGDHVGELPCCRRALCGEDLTNVPYSDGVSEIPCPIRHALEDEE